MELAQKPQMSLHLLCSRSFLNRGCAYPAFSTASLLDSTNVQHCEDFINKIKDRLVNLPFCNVETYLQLLEPVLKNFFHRGNDDSIIFIYCFREFFPVSENEL